MFPKSKVVRPCLPVACQFVRAALEQAVGPTLSNSSYPITLSSRLPSDPMKLPTSSHMLHSFSGTAFKREKLSHSGAFAAKSSLRFDRCVLEGTDSGGRLCSDGGVAPLAS